MIDLPVASGLLAARDQMAFTDAGGDLYVASQQILRSDELTVTSSCGLAGRSGFACTSQSSR